MLNNERDVRRTSVAITPTSFPTPGVAPTSGPNAAQTAPIQANPDVVSDPVIAPDSTSLSSPEEKINGEAVWKETKALLKASIPGGILGAAALAVAGAALGATGGLAGLAIAYVAAKVCGTVGAIVCGAVATDVAFKHSPHDIRALFYTFFAMVGGTTAGGVGGTVAGAALATDAAMAGGVAGQIAGAATMGPVGALLGMGAGMVVEYKRHPEKYPELHKAFSQYSHRHEAQFPIPDIQPGADQAKP